MRLINDFTVLSEEIREQTVPVGTALSELTLPDTLEVVVTGQTSEDTEDKMDDGGKEDAGGNGSDEDSEENDGEEPDDTEDEDSGTGETEEGEPDDTEQEDTETGGEIGDKDVETGDGQDEQPEDGESEETDGTTETENGDEGDSETEENSEGESAPAQETHTVIMPEYLAENVVSVQTLENTQTEKQDETVTIDGVTWQSEPEYDENTEGIYIFTAVLPDGYTLAEGVSLPQITVTVENGMYVDISMFIRIGAGDWNAITETDEPIEVVINIPEKLQSDGREFLIIRAHNGEYTIMNDLDDTPDTITVSTELFSSYAIAYAETDGADTDAKCGLCHICPTFLGICCFIWLAIILAVMVVVVILVLRRRKEEE